MNRFRVFKFAHLGRNILGNIDDDRPRTTSGCNVEGFLDRDSQILDVLDQEIMFYTRTSNPDGVTFLECILPDVMRRHLTGEHNHRNRIHVGGGDTGDGICHAGTGGNQSNADPLRRTRIGVCRVNSGLLMAHKHVLYLILLEKCIIDVKNGPTRVTEYTIHLFFLQAPDYNFCTADHHS